MTPSPVGDGDQRQPGQSPQSSGRGQIQAIAGQGQQAHPAREDGADRQRHPRDPATLSLGGVAKYEGIKVTYHRVDPAVGTTNYQPYAQAVIGSGANTVFEVLGAPTPWDWPPRSNQDGFKGTIYNGMTY